MKRVFIVLLLTFTLLTLCFTTACGAENDNVKDKDNGQEQSIEGKDENDLGDYKLGDNELPLIEINGK